MIIDASVAIKWLSPEPDSDAALALIGDELPLAPQLLLIEVGNALLKKVKKGEFRAEAVALQLQSLPAMFELIETNELIVRAAEIALALTHPIYDCVYLALAELRQDVVVTADQRLLETLGGTDFARLARSFVG